MRYLHSEESSNPVPQLWLEGRFALYNRPLAEHHHTETHHTRDMQVGDNGNAPQRIAHLPRVHHISPVIRSAARQRGTAKFSAVNSPLSVRVKWAVGDGREDGMCGADLVASIEKGEKICASQCFHFDSSTCRGCLRVRLTQKATMASVCLDRNPGTYLNLEPEACHHPPSHVRGNRIAVGCGPHCRLPPNPIKNRPTVLLR
ncbi:hypothetical protein L209DRAFT_445931 [Thermothelomyces heterothallicus CBS 203.75]